MLIFDLLKIKIILKQYTVKYTPKLNKMKYFEAKWNVGDF